MGKRESIKNRRDWLIPLLFLFTFVVLGTWARLVNAGGSASLWFDEAWRIQRLLDADSLFRQVVSSPNYIDPPVFSLAIYLLAQLYNIELVLRLVSIIPGVLAILAAYLVGRQLFTGRWTALLAAFLIAFSPWMTIFSKELKPYSLGVLLHLAVLYGFLRYWRRPELRWKMLLAGTLLCALFFSPNIVFAFPGICILMLVQAGESKNRRQFVESLGACATMLAGSALYFVAFLRSSTGSPSNDHLLSYWQDDFCPFDTAAAAAGWFFERFLAFYSEMAFTHNSLFDGVGAVLSIVYPLMALAGGALVLWRSRKRFLRYLCLFLLPILTMIPFNLLEIWPFGPLRMNLFQMVYIIFPPLILLDQLQRKRPTTDGFLPVGLVAVILMALQFPVHFGDHAKRRVTRRQSAEALINVIDNNPGLQSSPLLVNRSGMASFAYYSRHHQSVSNRFKKCADAFRPLILASQNSRFYSSGLLLRQCQKNRKVAVYMSHYSFSDRVLFRNDFSIEHHSFDGHRVHSCILESEIAGYEEDRQLLLSSKRFTGESATWKAVYVSPPLAITDAIPGALVVVNFDLDFKTPGKLLRFRFLGQDESGKPCLLSTIKNQSKRIPGHIESAVHVKLKEPIKRLKMVVSASGQYDFVLRDVTWFATRVAPPMPAIDPGVFVPGTGDRARVYRAMTSRDDFWPAADHTFGWTRGDSLITLDDLSVDPQETVLLLETFGWMPPRWREEMNRNGLKIYLNGDRRARFLGPGADPVRRYYFEIPSDIRTIRSIRIISNTFNPRKLGLNNDARSLGIDVKSVQFPTRTGPVKPESGGDTSS